LVTLVRELRDQQRERPYGWHYDLMLLMMNLVILLTSGGRLVLRLPL